MIAEAAALDPTQYVVQYELLRSQVIAASDVARAEVASQPRGVGLALLLREGMPGWVKAVQAVTRTSVAARTEGAVRPPAPERSAGLSTTPGWLSNARRHDIATLLASLVLSTRPVEHASSRQGH